VLGKKPEKLLHLRGEEIKPIIRKLDVFTEKVREDIENRMISEADGQELIVKATILVSMLTTT